MHFHGFVVYFPCAFVCAGTVGVCSPEVAQIRSKQNGNMQQGVGVGKLISALLAITQEFGSGF